MILPSKIELIGNVLLCQNIALDDFQKLAVLNALRAERKRCADVVLVRITELVDPGAGDGKVLPALKHAVASILEQ